MKTLASLLIFLLLAGCASAPPAPPAPSQLFSDATFGAPSERIGADDLFAMSPEMQAYLDSAAFRAQLHSKGPEKGLVDALYKQSALKLEYDSAATRNAAQTFQARRGNCMSLVIMTAAFAKALGLNVRYQNVVVDDSWRRAGGLQLASTHVNLSLSKSPHQNVRSVSGEDSALTVDFLPSEDVAGYRSYRLEETAIVAMYMNNRAVESLLHHQVDDAYWWARAAIAQNPAFIAAYNTLAVVYQRHGDKPMAERSFRAALAREPENVMVMQNLAPLLAALGKNEEAQALTRRIASIEPYPPFHFFDLGIAAMKRNDFAQAKTLFAREVQRAPYYDEFHFWLGVAYLQLGEPASARAQIALALDNSTTRDGRALYAAKLDHLRSQSPMRSAGF
jgi:tetratricopeptide (TPR) repeat protein